MTILQFAGYLSHQLINNADYLVSLYSNISQELRALRCDTTTAPNTVSILTPESTSTITEGDKIIISLRVLKDANGVVRPSLTPFLFNTEIKNVEASAMATSTTPITLTFTPPLDQLPHSAGPLAPVPNHSPPLARPSPRLRGPSSPSLSGYW